jgi:hypothetical protein
MARFNLAHPPRRCNIAPMGQPDPMLHHSRWSADDYMALQFITEIAPA